MSGWAYLTDVEQVERREVPYRKMAMLACKRALEAENFKIPVIPIAGIVFVSRSGEKYPSEIWRKQAAIVRPTQFGSAILNSAAGYAAIELGLRGPQIVVVHGDAAAIAVQQIQQKRSQIMLICVDSLDDPVKPYMFAFVMRDRGSIGVG